MYRAGYVFFHAGDRDEALRWFGEAVKHGYGANELSRDPELATLRKDPRFQRVLELDSSAGRPPGENLEGGAA
jgi:hypothetical protein